MSTTAFTLEQRIQRMEDIQVIHNVMSVHAYLHGELRNGEELELIWCKKAPDPSFTQNQGKYVGYDSIRYYYGEICERMKKANLQNLRKVFPHVEDVPENLGAGTMIMHTLTTPKIEVAGDGQTAKGVWYSPGQVTEVGPDGRPTANWIWEKYGVDFIKEDDEWKIWHMQVCTDFFTPVGKSWTEESQEAPMGVGGPPIELPRPDVDRETYRIYSMTQPPQSIPRLPEPYYTFSETFSY
jgi:hypothetical protein